MNCVFCGTEIEVHGPISRRDVCPNCGRDLHCCKQCKFYDPHSYNECKEVMAERVVDKERANLCEYFVVRGSSVRRMDKAKQAKEALENLFKKPS